MPVPYIHAQTHIPGGADTLFDKVSGAGTPNYYLNSSGVYAPIQSGGVSYTYWADDFPGNIQSIFIASNSGGTGAVSSIAAVDEGDGHPGICQLAPGTTASGYARCYYDGGIYPHASLVLTFRCLINCANFAGGDSNQYFFGFTDSAGPNVSASNHYVGFFFAVTSSADFLCYARNAASFTTDDSGVTNVANTWFDLKVIWTSAAAYYYINGSLVDTITTNLTTASVSMLPCVFHNNGSGILNKTVFVDTMELVIDSGQPGRFLLAPV